MTIFVTHGRRFTTFRGRLVAKEFTKTQLILLEAYRCRITASIQVAFCHDGNAFFIFQSLRMLASQTPPLFEIGRRGGSLVNRVDTQLRNLAAGVGMKIRPHVNCEYCYYYLFYICVKN